MTRAELIASLTKEEVIAAAHRLGMHDDHYMHIDCAACMTTAIETYLRLLDKSTPLLYRHEFETWLHDEIVNQKQYLTLRDEPIELYNYWCMISGLPHDNARLPYGLSPPEYPDDPDQSNIQ